MRDCDTLTLHSPEPLPVDGQQFDDLLRGLSRSRRSVVATVLAASGGLTGIAAVNAKKKRKKRKKKQKKQCKPNSVAQTCSGRCGQIQDNCNQIVDCGSCACSSLCQACFICQEGPNTPGLCVVDGDQRGDVCGLPGQICLPDGICACDATSCTLPETCGGGGVDEECGCSPITTCPGGQNCGTIDDGCGGDLDCGTCNNPMPICIDHVCTGCTTNAQCANNQICAEGSCQACDVTCTGSASDCGTALQAAINAADAHAILHICPGTYRGGFSVTRAITIIGAGQEDDPTNSTILDGNNAQRVMHIVSGTEDVELGQLRLTGGLVESAGIANVFGAGLYNQGTSLTMRDCTVAHSAGVGIWGAGIANQTGTMNLIRCTIRDNSGRDDLSVDPPWFAHGGGVYHGGSKSLTATDCLIADNSVDELGGGLFLDGGTTTLLGTTKVRTNNAYRSGGIWNNRGTLTISVDCRITGNTAIPGVSAGIGRGGGTVILEGPDPSPIVVDNCHQNCGDFGMTITKCAPGGYCPT